MIKTLLQKLPIQVALGISVVSFFFSPAANAQLIRQQFEGNFSLIGVSPLLEDTTPGNSDYSGFVLFSEDGTLEDWQISVDGVGLDLDPDSTLPTSLPFGLGPSPYISFDLSSPSDWNLSIDFGIAADAPRYILDRNASEITFAGQLGLAGGYTYEDSVATITETLTSVPEPGTIFSILAVGGLGLVVKRKEQV
ncbi:PEP-CTERM sorting domain-containing protein [Dapis sp. BLCC M126]|uniref:PEP-CTERM sorting domain-containing protein n=1 Tax=Dapis sp. BLCC M126 TaxID=3400189 RepID=UPI003CFB5947